MYPFFQIVTPQNVEGGVPTRFLCCSCCTSPVRSSSVTGIRHLKVIPGKKRMDNPQYYQPLSHALHPPLVPAGRSPQQQYNSYGSHAQNSAANGTTTGHREEEEEEEEDDEEIVEEELEHNDPDPQQSASTHSSPRAPAAQAQAGSTGCVKYTAPTPSANHVPEARLPPPTPISASNYQRHKTKHKVKLLMPIALRSANQAVQGVHETASLEHPSDLQQKLPQTRSTLGSTSTLLFRVVLYLKINNSTSFNGGH